MGKRKKTAQPKSPKSSGFTYRLPALRAIQAGEEYFTTAVPFSVLVKLTEGSQSRTAESVDQNRVNDLASYIVKNRTAYVLPAITASVGKDCRFESAESSKASVEVGVLEIPINSAFAIHDGQYRCSAIAQALEQVPELGDESVSLVLYLDQPTTKRRFSDIRIKQRRSARSERIVSDPADEIAQITRDVIASVEAFTDSIEMVKTTISNRSKNLFTFSALYQANELLLKPLSDRSKKDRSKLAIDFWQAVQYAIPDWTSETPRVDLRKQTIHAHGVTLCAIASAGSRLVERFPKTWKRKLKRLRDIDWSRSNKQWEGKAMLGGRMTKSAASVELTASQIWKAME